MSNKGRVVTLVVKIQTDEYPQWIFDAHLKGPQNDVKVIAISEGDVIKEHDKLLEEIEERDSEDFARCSEGDLD